MGLSFRLLHGGLRVHAAKGSNEYLLRNKHFACTECGKCCTGSGVVWCNATELGAIKAIVDPEATLDGFVDTYVAP
jgi:hypothetical protein